MFKSAEERAADRAQREAEEAKQQAERAEQARAAEDARKRAAYLATPIGAATAAREAGQRFFEVQLQVGGHRGSAGFGSAEGQHTTASSAETLGEIEKIGWRLEHVGYVYVVTRESTTDHFMATGQEVAVSGITVGVYLFRNTDPVDS